MKKIFLILFLSIGLIVLFISVFLINFASASFTKGNQTEAIANTYNPGEVLRGWINISIKDESTNSLLTAFGKSISLYDFLDKNDADFTCIPDDCESGYSSSGEDTKKSFSLNAGESKVIGFKVTGKDMTINSFSALVKSSAEVSNIPQLSIDILNDNSIEWASYKSSGSHSTKNQGCFVESDSTEQAEITTIGYCEDVSLGAFPELLLGADVIADEGGSVYFELNIYNDQYSSVCDVRATASGSINCTIEDIQTRDEENFSVCIKVKDAEDSGKYKIKYEEVNTCGFPSDYEGEYVYDYDIFVQVGRYKGVGNFTLNNDEIEDYGSSVSDIADYMDREYIDWKYNRNCSLGCVIPIKFISHVSQTINVSNIQLSYSAKGSSNTLNKIYDTEEVEALINFGFQKLELDVSGLKVPVTPGNKTLELKLDNNLIFQKNINIANQSSIKFVLPVEVPAGLPVKFTSFVIGNITEFKWTFGDDTSTQTTTTNFTIHRYMFIGEYDLNLTVKDSSGKKSSKIFTINVVSPREAINNSLIIKKAYLANITKDLVSITSWYKSTIEKILDLESIDDELKRIERDYVSASTSDEFEDIMNDLIDLDIPYSLRIGESFFGIYIPSLDDIYADDLSSAGAGEEIENSEEAILSWMLNNVNIEIDRKIYRVSFEQDSNSIATAVVIKITPKQDIEDDVYLMINQNYDDLEFKEDYNEKKAGESTAIVFEGLNKGEVKTIEFVEEGGILFDDLGVFISPQFSELPEIGIDVEACDLDGKCESGENWKNCRPDCKPWGWTIFYLMLLLFVAFIVYIILQEWYKRYYEGNLFKDKNELYNLIYFMHNAINQNLSKDEIFKLLDKQGWNREKVAYAYRKIKNERTGMWEIPVFKWVEKIKVKKEIAKRENQQLRRISQEQNQRPRQGNQGNFNNFRRKKPF